MTALTWGAVITAAVRTHDESRELLEVLKRVGLDHAAADVDSSGVTVYIMYDKLSQLQPVLESEELKRWNLTVQSSS